MKLCTLHRSVDQPYFKNGEIHCLISMDESISFDITEETVTFYKFLLGTKVPSEAYNLLTEFLNGNNWML